jgi:hypothetical protein
MGLAIGMGWLDIRTSPTQHSINGQRAARADKEAAQNNPLQLFWDWTTKDAVSFYTFVLAIFTGILGITAIKQIKAARMAADAAYLNAQAVIDAERAHLYVIIANETIESTFKSARYNNTPEMNPTKMNGPGIQYALRNYGKTPAILHQVWHCLTSGLVGRNGQIE